MPRTLPPDFDRRLLALLGTPGLTFSDVVARLGVSQATVRRHADALRLDGAAIPVAHRHPGPDPQPPPAKDVHLSRRVLRRRIAAWYRWQARRRRLGSPAAGTSPRNPRRALP